MGGRSPFVPDLDERWQYARRHSLPPLPAREDEPSGAWLLDRTARSPRPAEPLWPPEAPIPAPRAPRYGDGRYGDGRYGDGRYGDGRYGDGRYGDGYGSAAAGRGAAYDTYDAPTQYPTNRGRAAQASPWATPAPHAAAPHRRGLLAPDAPWRAEVWEDARHEMSAWQTPGRPPAAWQAPQAPQAAQTPRWRATAAPRADIWVAAPQEDEWDDEALWEADTVLQPRIFSGGPPFDAARQRAASASGQLAAWGTSRPMVRLPADRRSAMGLLRGKRGHLRTRLVKLPPVWMLVNLVILLVAGVIAAPHVFAAQSSSCAWYTVAPGDTLWGLAGQYNTNVNALSDANQLANPNQIFVGQRLCIPSQAAADSTVVPPQVHPRTPTAKPAPATKPAPTAKPSPSATKTKTPTIQGPTAFIKFALPYAQRAHAATGWPVSVILAQWGLEHGWKLPSFTGYNFGNVAAIAGEPVIPGTQAKGSPAHFAYAPTPEDGLRQYIRVAQLRWYRSVTAAAKVSTDKKACANKAAVALGASAWDAGHYGGASAPGSSLLRIMSNYNLYQYDK